MDRCIFYKGGYKYQLKVDYSVSISIHPPKPIQTEYVSLDSSGQLTMKNGYAWDGPSGPTIDTPSFMRGSLVHDALYQLMRENCIDHDTCRDVADRTLQAICIEDGMWRIRAWWVYQGVRLFGKPCSDPAKKRPVKCAPRNCQR
ncbi:MAG: hypothetical protein PHW08_07635 [Kiritimatiellae bacterium]|nr:hypothetical protein [Kiritimatiellia bacterium]